ncbi:GlxA family transcriptional regulator [Aliiroseovarius sp. KMU-50]|uniref:GlxA family transcriptional regulator n=1 Tax=Aliiroseovarius salicola TaxID=3009082 RepID=A0ABT4W586_9RHOB|nr:GlxA family transcriptional regulator [Aliiroseovarius sp. KMU-50]MDA5095682.1 GlxA family transcriptional regulator [Aliiroseovarius sp. KMU-50]
MTERSFISKGAASFPIAHEGAPTDVYFLLLPKVTMLALSAAVEPLRIANQVTNKELYRWFLLSEDGNPVRCSNGIAVTPDFDLINLPKSSLAFVVAGVEPADTTSPRILNWISRQRAFGCQIGGICTGAFTLAKAGLLKGRQFTLHWENQPAFNEHFVGLTPSNNLFEVDGGVMTCGGGNASLDMMLYMIERDHGKDLAVIIADMCIHARSNTRKSPQKSAYSEALSVRNQHLINAMQYMNTQLEEGVSMDEVADHVNISRRQLERLFKIYVGTSPLQFYADLRVKRAYALLNETSLSITEIAAASGFTSTSQLANQFRKRFGHSPSSFRKTWHD